MTDQPEGPYPKRVRILEARIEELEAALRGARTVIEAARDVRATAHPDNPRHVSAMNTLRQALIRYDQRSWDVGPIAIALQPTTEKWTPEQAADYIARHGRAPTTEEG